jgi:hypothetical protein
MIDLNLSLDAFYAEHAARETAEKWLDDHSFRDSIGNCEEHAWMYHSGKPSKS